MAPPRGSELAAEQAAGQPVFRATFGTARPGGPLRNALDIELKNPANTNVLLWGDVPHTRLLALWEARARPCSSANFATRDPRTTARSLVLGAWQTDSTSLGWTVCFGHQVSANPQIYYSRW